MRFRCFSNIKIKAFMKRVWNKLNKLWYFMSEIMLVWYYALIEELPNFTAKIELNKTRHTFFTNTF